MDDDAACAVRVAALSKRFGTLAAVDRLDLAIRPAEVFGLVGPDGAGKTTTIRMLAGVMPADDGRIEVDGVDVLADPEAVRHRVSYMPQRFGLYEDLTVDENIRFFADLFSVPKQQREERAARLLAASGMEAFRRRRAGQLSGGMKQKLGLTCALIHTPRVLLLDEPTTGVDPVSRRDFWRILYGLREEGVTIVISTAYLDEAERCTRLALLDHGRLVHCDTPAALRQRMPGRLIAIASPQARAVLAALDGMPGIVAARLVGDRVHAVVRDAGTAATDLAARLDAAAVPYTHVGEEPPSVEDVFVALLENGGDRK